MNYEVIVSVAKRDKASFHGNNVGETPVGYKFKSVAESPDVDPVDGAIYPVVWQQDEIDGNWLPMNHHTKNIVYLEALAVVPPPTENLPFVLDVQGYKPFNGELIPDA